MKKWLTALLLTLLMVCMANAALAVEAADITDECKFKTTSSKYIQWGFYLFYPVHMALLALILA